MKIHKHPTNVEAKRRNATDTFGIPSLTYAGMHFVVPGDLVDHFVVNVVLARSAVELSVLEIDGETMVLTAAMIPYVSHASEIHAVHASVQVGSNPVTFVAKKVLNLKE